MGGVFAACESLLQRAGRNREMRKLPATCRTESRNAKASCSVQDEIAKRESFPQRAGRNREARKLPAACRTKSRSAKDSCSVQDEIARLESFLQCAGRDSGAGQSAFFRLVEAPHAEFAAAVLLVVERIFAEQLVAPLL